MKSRIYLKQWLHSKPEHYSSKTDLHYLKIANSIYLGLENNQKLVLKQFMDEADVASLCCFITCYYEDVISQTNIWKAFKTLYAKSYGKALPFYTLTEEYLDEEINAEDVAFLIWYFLNTIQGEKFVSPHNEFITNIAKQAMEVLNEDYEFAPENTVLKKFYQINSEHFDATDEFYQTRDFLYAVFFDSYLFYTDIKRRFEQDVFETIEDLSEEKPQMVMSYIREVTEAYTFSKSSALLALNAKDWASAVVGETDAHYKSLTSISQKVKGLFLYKSQTETDVTLEHIASGMLFKMTKKSFDSLEDIEEDYIIYIGLVKYNGEWWFSGNFSASPFNADLILDEKNSAKSRSEVSFLEDQAQMASIMEQQKQAFLDFNQGSLVAFLSAADLNPFLEAYMTFFNDSLKLSDQEKEAAHKRTKADGYFGNTAKEDPLEGEDKVFVVYFNPKSGIEFYDDIINAFPDERNSFFTEESREDVQYILMSATCSTEFTNYFVEHYKDRLDYFKSEPYKSYLNDLDFLLRFWKKDNYHTKSTVVLTGKDGQ